MEKWFEKHPNIDVGFSFIHREWLKNKYNKFVKGKCNIQEFLKYKYILSIEGNDKDSGLNWKLNSNSVVSITDYEGASNFLLKEQSQYSNDRFSLIKLNEGGTVKELIAFGTAAEVFSSFGEPA